MRFLFFILLSLQTSHAGQINPQRVGIIYNSTIDESRRLAESYAKARGIPATNLLPLSLPDKGTITRDEYNTLVRDPLRRLFDVKNLWTRQRQADGITLPVKKSIDILVCMRGMPIRVSRQALPEGTKPKGQFGARNEASVDSELCLLGVDGVPMAGPTPNKYFKSSKSFSDSNLPFIFLTGRIDGPSWEICHRLYQDAIDVEKTGLWGMSYLDLSKKYPEGDEWIRNIGIRNTLFGIPSVTDPHKLCFPAKYPMNDAALYYGWYAHHRNGPLLNPGFRFKKGAVAIHLHSFSAAQLRTNSKHWCGPLLAAGAAATVGNVFEPYLSMTHPLDTFHAALLSGRPLIEAAYTSIPVLSWQSIVVGDPLYRPFLHFDKLTGKTTETDRPFRAIRAGTGEWGERPAELKKQLAQAAAEMESPEIYEALGLQELRSLGFQKAQQHFITAINLSKDERVTQLRNNLHIIEVARQAKLKDQAVSRLKKLKIVYKDLPEVAAVTSLLTQLDPPPPQPTPPGKKPKNEPAAKR